MSGPAADSSGVAGLVAQSWGVFALLAGLQLELFVLLNRAPKSAAEIADALTLNVEKLRPLLNALVHHGVLTVDGERFANTTECAERFGSPGSGEHYRVFWRAALRTAESVRSGLPAAKPADVAAYFAGVGLGTHIADSVAQAVDLSNVTSLIDIGCGQGGMAVTLLEHAPHLHITLVDLPEVIPLADAYQEKQGVAGRVTTVGLDVVRDTLASHVDGPFDLATMSRLLHVLPAGEAVRALRNAFEVLRGDGVLCVASTLVLDPDAAGPRGVVDYSLSLLNLEDAGRAHSEEEYHSWAKEAGFATLERVAADTMVARKR